MHVLFCFNIAFIYTFESYVLKFVKEGSVWQYFVLYSGSKTKSDEKGAGSPTTSGAAGQRQTESGWTHVE